MKRTILSLITALLCGFFAAGCSCFAPSHEMISVTCAQPQAQVWINGNYQGPAPLQVSVMRDHSLGIMVKKDGYETSSQLVGYGFSTTGVLDLVGGFFFLLPFAGLLCAGSHSLDETSLHFNLAPLASTNSASMTH